MAVNITTTLRKPAARFEFFAQPLYKQLSSLTYMKQIDKLLLALVAGSTGACSTIEPLPKIVGPKAILVAPSPTNFFKPYSLTLFAYNPEEQCVSAQHAIDNKVGSPLDENHSKIEVSANTPISTLTILTKPGTLGCWAPFHFIPEAGATYYFINEIKGDYCQASVSKNSKNLTPDSQIRSLPVEHRAISGKICPTH